MVTIGVCTVLLAIAVAAVLTRSLTHQIGDVDPPRPELVERAAGRGDPAGVRAREQASAMTEIATTISELLATSRQIAESAQRVSQIARADRVRGPRRRPDGRARPTRR